MHLSELWVDASARGAGLGTRLLSEAEEYAMAHNCTRIHLETRSEPARALYERVGYKVFGTLENYDAEQAFYYLVKELW